MSRNWKKIFAALLVLTMLLPLAPAAAASEGEEDDARFAGKSWEEIIDEFLAEHNAAPESVACGWCNTVTGEEQYHNPDQYMVSGSMYKVPINMIFTEKVHNGEISWDTFIGGYRYEYCLHATIVDSNNDIAKGMWDYLGGYQPYRHILAPYMGEDPDTVEEKFYENNFFTPRQMIYALRLLATESERFPKLIDEMLQAEPNKYFKERAHDYDIAQKYGYWPDPNGWHVALNDCAIIYTEEPICIVIFIDSVNERASRELLKDFCDLMIAYTEYTTPLRKEAERIAAEEAAIAALNSPSPAPQEDPDGDEPTDPAATAAPQREPGMPDVEEEESAPGLFWPAALGLCTLAGAIWLALLSVRRARHGKLSLPWALAAVLLAAAAIAICLLPGQRAAKPASPAAAAEDTASSAEAQAAVTAFFDSLVAHDYARAYPYLYGTATLGLENEPESEDAALLLDAVRDSWGWRLYGDCSLTRSGALQQVVFTALDLERMRADVRAATETEVERLAGELAASEIYAEDGSYLPSFTERAYSEALASVLARADEYVAATGLNVRLVKDGGEWLIVPDSALYGALTGGAVN
ncbi:MAG: hypothetical protein IJS79_06355 [Oscillospiraceae bacterium]|nr:hypothetical protein [Oscillospiraceae bacterium]